MTSTDTSQSASDPTKTLGMIGVAGVVTFALVFVAMHAIQPDLDPVERFGSDYANGGGGWLMQVGILAAAVGPVAVALGLRRSLVSGKRKRLGIALLFIVGIGFAGSGLFKADPPRPDGTTGYTPRGAVHDLSGMVLFLSLVVGTFVLAGVFGRDPRWRRWAPTARIFGSLILAGLVVTVAAAEIHPPGSDDESFAGLAQRLFFAAALTWLVVLGLHLRRLGSAPTGHTGTDSAPSEPPAASPAETRLQQRRSTGAHAESLSKPCVASMRTVSARGRMQPCRPMLGARISLEMVRNVAPAGFRRRFRAVPIIGGVLGLVAAGLGSVHGERRHAADG